jgi:hypothetical protein
MSISIPAPTHARTDSNDSVVSLASAADQGDEGVALVLSASDEAGVLGRVPREVVEAMKEDNDRMRAMRCETVWEVAPDGRSVAFTEAVNDEGAHGRDRRWGIGRDGSRQASRRGRSR